ncbi:hypothetical protein PAXRUDRAFT_151810 [Paxillus rubicundulus Ve08.2h10]|uniref:Unplaced genomic scaffold scaffold_688, whole genome shotgun sequence n=1 Tax=Paxillus rubicundulus Ve08.2h10 TaxID=930991 RepID=A0A0D0DRP9_9AGAM|nr:hypothetical protein PAXRUDRAFT_151810 [Paxillus rubicundulus Ve08.2h10]
MSSSSNSSTCSLHSHGIINPAIFELVKSSKKTKCKKPAVWTTDEESALLNFLFSELPKISDGNFKKATWNAASSHLMTKSPSVSQGDTPGEKTAKTCECKFKVLNTLYYAIVDLKKVSGLTYTDQEGAGVTHRTNIFGTGMLR